MHALITVALVATGQLVVNGPPSTPVFLTAPPPGPAEVRAEAVAETFRQAIPNGTNYSVQEWWAILTPNNQPNRSNPFVPGRSMCIGQNWTDSNETYTEANPQVELVRVFRQAAPDRITPRLWNDGTIPFFENGSVPPQTFRDSYVNQTFPHTFGGVQGVLRWEPTTDTFIINNACFGRGWPGIPSTLEAFELVWEGNGTVVRYGQAMTPPDPLRPALCVNTRMGYPPAPWGTTQASAQAYAAPRACKASALAPAHVQGLQVSTRAYREGQVVEGCVPITEEGPQGQQVYVGQDENGNWFAYYESADGMSTPVEFFDDPSAYLTRRIAVPCIPQTRTGSFLQECPAVALPSPAPFQQCQVTCSTFSESTLSCSVINRHYSWRMTPPLSRNGVSNGVPDGYISLTPPFTLSGRFPSNSSSDIGVCLDPSWDRSSFVQISDQADPATAYRNASGSVYIGDVFCMTF